MKHVYTLEELPTIAADPAFREKPARFAVIGQPIHHSASPQMHQAALDKESIAATYIRLEIAPGKVRSAFETMRRLGFIGVNVTVPHKKEALEACDTLTQEAELFGAVNTVHLNDEIQGSNSDGPGFVRAIKTSFNLDLSATSVLILGAGGGAGTAIASQCALIDAPKIVLANRTVQTAINLADRLSTTKTSSHITACSLETSALKEHIEHVDLIINTTSLGLKEEDPMPMDSSLIKSQQYYYDTIYQPEKTKLYQAAEKKGISCANGRSLLLHQGAISFKTWTEIEPEIEVMKRGLEKQVS